MAVTNESAVQFCNEQARPVADKLAKAKHAAVTAAQQWSQLSGTNDSKLAQMANTLQWAANRIWWAWNSCEELRVIWRANQFSSSAQPQFIDNNPSEDVFDNEDRTGQDPNRPLITGQDIRRLLWRAEEFSNFLLYEGLAGAAVWVNENGLTVETVSRVRLEKSFRLSQFSLVVPVGSDANQFATVCQEISDEYLVNNTPKWDHILTVSVNPGNQLQV